MLEECLTSLAILKVNWDQRGHDYVQNFIPFIAEGLQRCPDNHVSVTKLQEIIKDSFGLIIPQGAINTLLRRAQREGYVRRESGVFIRNLDAIPQDFRVVRENAARQQRALIQKMVTFCKERHNIQWSEEEAENALLSHLQSSCVPILAASVVGCPIPPPGVKVANAEFLISSFIVHLDETDPEGFGFLETVMKGNLLATALFLPDIAKAKQKFADLEAYIDTRILLRALGLEGEGLKGPCIELLTLLYEMNVSLACFDITFSELSRILDAAQYALKDPRHQHKQGLFSVYEHLHSIGARASDVELIIANLEKSLKRLHIHIKPCPPHTIQLGLDEKKLEQIVSEELPDQRHEAQRHDVDCLTAIHRLRKGQVFSEVERCKFIFVTSNSALARAGAKFSRIASESERITVPLCINDHMLATLAWVKNPTYATNFSKHRLIADSYAALRPSNELWRKYLNEISRLRENGELTDHDYHLLRFSTVARNALLDATLGSPDAFTEGTVPEVLEVARADARKEVESRLKEEMAMRAAAVSETQSLHERLASQRRRQDERFNEIASNIGRCAGTGVYLALFMVFAIGFYATMPPSFPQLPDAARSSAQFAIGIFALLALWNVAEAGSIRVIARRVEIWVSRRVVAGLVKIFGITEDM